MFNFSVLPPLSLYIHIPWCVRKCPYCDFNSHAVRDELPQQAYIEALLRDLEQDLPRIWGRKIISIFIGGGTPSLFSPEALDQLMSGLRARLNLLPEAEVTLEANPGTLEAGKFTEYRSLGINRLSIGVQSFHDDSLQRLGRIHGRHEALKAAEAAHEAGFENFNLDLMFGLPGQSPAMAQEDMATAIDLEPGHISYYQLTLEPNTLFHNQPPVLPGDELIWEIQQQGQQQLFEAGYGQYEVSAYAREGRRCRHNLNYWEFGDYLGVGAGAHGKITDASQQNITRLSKLKQPADYMSKSGAPEVISSERVLSRDEVGLEFMMNALRLTEGFETSLFATHTGQAISLVQDTLNKAVQKGLIEWDVKSIRPTDQGRLYLDDLIGLFV